MASKTCDWRGKSGTDYTYEIHKLPVSFEKGYYGNYIYTKLNSDNQWTPIYIGEGDLSERIGTDHHQAKCIASKGATHVHAHQNAGGKKAGKKEEADILERFTNAYQPNGCNDKKGG